ncbi:MAG: N-acetylneuraminate synthase family protein, partial [Spirochaetales bacterium]|nr:N-acetylneuraminate synthase family protein [Spirochaetales bacterium]
AGISDHSRDPILVPVITTALGGSIIEKHITMINNGDGLDDPIAITPDELAGMCMEIRKAENRTAGDTFAWLNNLYGKDKIKKILGTGIKKLAPSETANYRTTNRSIMAVTDIAQGEDFTEENTTLLRSEKTLNPGLSPDFYPEVLKRKAARNIKSGSGIIWDCF